MALADPATFGGRVFELGGPKIYAFRDIIAWIAREIRVDKPLIEVPPFAARAMGRAGDFLSFVPMTSGQYVMLQSDNVAAPPGFAAFGIDRPRSRRSPRHTSSATGVRGASTATPLRDRNNDRSDRP